MKKVLFLFLATAWLARPAPPSRKPKLVLAIAVDQFRYDYLTRFRSQYAGGLDRLITNGAVFTNAWNEHFPTVTAVGHSTFLTGATPSISGIVGNEWYDRQAGRQVFSVADDSVKIVGGEAAGGASPRRLLVSTLGDELKIASGGASRVIGISLKDRSAILPSGHMSDGAFWFDNKTGNFVSSTFYFAELPAWVRDFNASRPADRYRGVEWLGKKLAVEAGETLYASMARTPFGNELIEALAERAIQAEQLGSHAATDLLTISFSSNDYVGHDRGPDSPEVRDISIRTDILLGKLFQFVASRADMRNVLVVLTSDHGVAPVPEVSTSRRMPGGRMPPRAVQDTIQAALTQKYGPGMWISSSLEHFVYLNWELIREKNLDREDVAQAALEAVMAIPHVFRVYTRGQLMNGKILQDQVGSRVQNGFCSQRGADITVLLDPYWISSVDATTHETPFSYDSHVPVIFMGPGIRAGRYHQNIALNDIAPTLATILDVEVPSGSVGRVLAEILE